MKTQLSDLLLNDRGFAFDPVRGETYQLNTTGLVLVKMLQTGMTEAQILEAMQEKYEVEENTARRDLEGFFDELETIGWKA